MPATVRDKPKMPALSPQSKALCKRLGITRYVPIALRIVEECFPLIVSIETFPEVDPECGDEWLVIMIRVRGTAKQVREQYSQYTSQKVSLLPVKTLDLIRLMHIRQ